jgi:type IV secretory pathway VirB4 component
LRKAGEGDFRSGEIGHVPGTTYGISIDLDHAVTHNTAILGILGVGKTRLAWELIQRMLIEGIKVVAIDCQRRLKSDPFLPV